MLNGRFKANLKTCLHFKRDLLFTTLHEPLRWVGHFQGPNETDSLASAVKENSEFSQTFKFGYSIPMHVLQHILKFQAQEFLPGSLSSLG